jgi:hypothetical protein
MRFLCWLSILAFAASMSRANASPIGRSHQVNFFANPAQPQGSKDAARTSRAFADRVQEYVKMQKDLEGSGSPAAGNSTKDSEQIADRQHALAGRIAAARHGSRQGDIFTHEVAEEFEKIIRKAFKEPSGRAMRRTIEDREPVKLVVLHVNDVCPEDLSRTTMPPTLLRGLPVLPKELAYRIIGRALVLEDIKTNLIVDFIPNAIP